MNLRGLHIMVTGAAGFIGSHLSERLAVDNSLVLIDDFSVGPRENLSALETLPHVRIVEADVTDRDGVHALMNGVDVVFHLAISCLRTSLRRPFASHEVNAGGSLNVCWAAHERRVRRLIYVSSSEVYGTAETVPMNESHPCQPMTVYGASKLAGELYALAYGRTYGLPVAVVRPFNTYGPRAPYLGARAEVIPRFFLLLSAGRSPVIYGDGSQTRDFTFVEDTVDGLIRAAECDRLVGDLVNVACGREVSIRRVAELLAEGTGRRDVSFSYADPRPGDVQRHLADVGKAKRLFGFEPTTNIEAGLARTVAWFREHDIARRVDAADSAAPNW